MSETCKVCLQEDTVQNLITPCLCDGTSKYVHRKCLNDWRKVKLNNKCEICLYEYKFEMTNELKNIINKYHILYDFYFVVYLIFIHLSCIFVFSASISFIDLNRYLVGIISDGYYASYIFFGYIFFNFIYSIVVVKRIIIVVLDDGGDKLATFFVASIFFIFSIPIFLIKRIITQHIKNYEIVKNLCSIKFIDKMEIINCEKKEKDEKKENDEKER